MAKSAEKVAGWKAQQEGGDVLSRRKQDAIRTALLNRPFNEEKFERRTQRRLGEATAQTTQQGIGMMQTQVDPSLQGGHQTKKLIEGVKAVGSAALGATKGIREQGAREKIAEMTFREQQHQFDKHMQDQRAGRRADRVMKIGGAVLGGLAGLVVTGGNPLGALAGASLGSQIGGGGRGGSGEMDYLCGSQ